MERRLNATWAIARHSASEDDARGELLSINANIGIYLAGYQLLYIPAIAFAGAALPLVARLRKSPSPCAT